MFAQEKYWEALRGLLNDVLQPMIPIESVKVMNPDIHKDGVDDRGLVLDILAVHNDGTITNLEMQMDDRKDTEKRSLYHWSRTFRDAIDRGAKFSKLVPLPCDFPYKLHVTPDKTFTYHIQSPRHS